MATRFSSWRRSPPGLSRSGGPAGEAASRLALAAVALLAGLAQFHPVYEPDLWWHLWGGREVLASGGWFIADHASFLQDGWIWQNTEWLFQLIAWSLWSAFGPTGVQTMVAILAAAGAALVGLLALRLAPGRPWLAAGATGLAAAATLYNYTPRPQGFLLTFLPLALLLMEGALTRRRAVATVALGLVWAHLHASYVLLPALVMLRAIGDRAERRSWYPRLALASLLVALSLLLGPLGPGVVAEILDHAATESARGIGDMRPAVVADLLPAGLGPHLAALILVGCALVRGVVTRPRRLDDFLLLALGIALTLTAIRFRSAAALLALPLLLRDLPAPSGPARTERVLALLVALAAVPQAWIHVTTVDPSRRPGWGVFEPAIPVGAADLMASHAGEGRLYNHYDDGGYLVYRLAPDMKVMIDGRTPTFYDSRHYALWQQAERDPRTLAMVLQAWEVNWALIRDDHLSCRLFRDQPAWRVVFMDHRRLLLTRSGVLPGLDLTAIARCAGEPRLDAVCADPAQEAEARAQIRTLEQLGGSDTAALLRVRLASCPGAAGVPDLLADARSVLRLDPDVADLVRVVEVLVRAGRAADALSIADRAWVRWGRPELLATKARVLGQLGPSARGRAANAWDAAVAAVGADLPPAGRLDYARTLMAAGRWADAAEQARRCAWSGDRAALDLLRTLLPRMTPAERARIDPFLPPAARR